MKSGRAFIEEILMLVDSSPITMPRCSVRPWQVCKTKPLVRGWEVTWVGTKHPNKREEERKIVLNQKTHVFFIF